MKTISRSTNHVRWRMLISVLIACTALFSACGREYGTGSAQNQVYTSIYPVFYLTSRVAEGGLPVKEMIPPSADPHNWEPSPKQIAELESGALFIYNGAGLEPWGDQVSDLLKNSGVPVLDLSSAFTGKLLPAGEHNHQENLETSGNQDNHYQEHHDPHFWLDPVIAKEIAGKIKNALIEADPGNKDLYEQNYAALAGDLEELHEEYSSVISRCGKKEFVVTHQAFGYLAMRYGLDQIAVMGVSPESEPSPGRLAELSHFLKEHGLDYVFTEPFSSARVAETLASETGAGVLELHPIGGLTEAQVSAGEDYLSLMRKNLEQLKVALEYE